MAELVAVMFAMAVVSLGAVALYRGLQERSMDARAESALASVAGAQETYHQSRGQWATGSALNGLGREGVALTGGPSTGTDVVNVETVDVSGEDWLGLAILVEPGRCMTYLLPPPEETDDPQIETSELGAGTPCTWSAAS